MFKIILDRLLVAVSSLLSVIWLIYIILGHQWGWYLACLEMIQEMPESIRLHHPTCLIWPTWDWPSVLITLPILLILIAIIQLFRNCLGVAKTGWITRSTITHGWDNLIDRSFR